jgi:alkaline phosphatase
LQGQGYPYVTTRTALNALDMTATHKLLALFHLDHMDYELDRVKKALDQPSLAEMTLKAIEVLNQGKEGYFLMVEGGRIDHALHGTNAKRVMEDTIAFDEAIKAALGKVDLSNTLIVVTADHDHTMTMNGYAKKGNPILDIARGNDGLPLKDADGKSYTTLVFGNGPNRPDMRADVDSAVALGDDYLQETGVHTNSETHGGGDVMLMASGAGAKIFKGTLDNTKVFSLLKSAFGF